MWDIRLFYVYMATNVLTSGVYGLAAFFYTELRWYDTSEGIPIIAKLIVFIVYSIVCKIFLPDNNKAMEIITINDQLHED